MFLHGTSRIPLLGHGIGLVNVDTEVILCQLLKHLADEFYMLLFCLSIYQYIIYINYDFSRTFLTENIIEVSLAD